MRVPVAAVILLTFMSCGIFFCGCSSTPTKALQSKPAPPLIEFIGQWGTKGNGPGTLDDPRSIATDDFAAVFIADNGRPDRFIHKFTRGGHPLESFTPQVQFHDPCAAAVDHTGAIYVLECSTGVLYTFEQDAKLLHAVHTGLNSTQKPLCLAVDNDGRIYIATARSKRVMMFSPRGGAIGALGAKRPKPQGAVTADQVAVASDGTLFVADSASRSVTRVSIDGTTQNSWTWSADSTPASADDASFLAVTPKYIVILTNSSTAPAFHIFGLNDNQEKIYKTLLEVDSSLSHLDIKGIAVTPDGELLMLDAVAPRVLRFRLN
jgi:DNA-binding beta-propeller fold protein YncE